MNRRQFLSQVSLACLAGCATPPLAGDGGLIDGHVHVWTPDTRHYPLAHGFGKVDMEPLSFTPEQLFAHSRREGVRRVVLIQMNFYGFDNRYLLKAIAEHRGIFRGVAIIDETKPDVRARMKSLAAQGVRGFRLYAEKEQVEAWSHSEGMKQMWAYGAESGLAMCLLTEPDALPAVSRMCRAYPKTPVVIDHFARIGMKKPVRQHELDQLCRLSDFHQTHLKTSAFYALGHKKAPYTDLAPMIRAVHKAYGASRLIWGSDCPFQVQDGHTYANSIALIRDRLDFLSAEDKSWMLRKTAERVFFS